MLTKYKAVIFDFDGTIVDTERIKLKSMKILLKDYDLNFKKDSKLLGMSSRDYFAMLMDKYNINLDFDEMVEKREKILEDLFSKEEIKILPGFLKLVKSLKKNNIKIGLATSASKKFLTFILNKIEIKKYFNVIHCGDDVEHSKPNPEIFLLTAKDLDIDPKNCVVIEDSINGVKAGKAAGMDVIAVTNTFSKKHLTEADIILDSLEEISI
jgi:beta-phosphoglucomutase family hydrolase|tara:strand:+ start:20107 stop:20739 length:633 start_codon:yes stop_codon:yes gene_type:complete